MCLLLPKSFILLVFAFLQSSSPAQLSPWDGDWITDEGEMSFVVEGTELSGSFGNEGDVSGTAEGEMAEIQIGKEKRQL